MTLSSRRAFSRFVCVFRITWIRGANARRHLPYEERVEVRELFEYIMPLNHEPSRSEVESAVTDRKRIFQVAYREEHFLARANLLRRQGYTVTSTIGNEAAKAVLPILPRVDLLVIGHAAPKQTRLDMVAWLFDRYPGTTILALNPSHEPLGTLRLNAVHYPAEAWLPLIEAALDCGARVG